MQGRQWWKWGWLIVVSGAVMALPLGGCLQSTLQRIIVGAVI